MTTAGMTELHKMRRERVLKALTEAGSEGLPTVQLARKCALSSTAARRQLLRLEDDGLVWSHLHRSTQSKKTAHLKRVWSLRPTRKGETA